MPIGATFFWVTAGAGIAAAVFTSAFFWARASGAWKKKIPNGSDVTESFHANAFRTPFLGLITLSGLLLPLSAAGILLTDARVSPAAAAGLSLAAGLTILGTLGLAGWGVSDMATKTSSADSVTFKDRYWAPGSQLSAAFGSLVVGMALVVATFFIILAQDIDVESNAGGPGISVSRPLPALGWSEKDLTDDLGKPVLVCDSRKLVYLLSPSGAMVVNLEADRVTRIVFQVESVAKCESL